MRFVDWDLSEADAAWVRQEMFRANVALAVADVRRQVVRAEDRAGLSNVPSTASANPANTAPEQNTVDEHDANEKPDRLNSAPLTSVNTSERHTPTPSIVYRAREQLRSGVSNSVAVAHILRVRPDVNPASLGVRRERSKAAGYL
ncbi:hypothetical protein ACWEOA_30385 [Streptomyces sp. NPDC004457]|uniref:hypothetical protein n=1 Tax=Streptomyces spinosus TaxID=2872623 RepID=UPI001CED24B8|nr:hypothetical protein [Streptomyces spinosus]